MYCRNCGFRNEDNASFCINCGEKLETTKENKTMDQLLYKQETSKIKHEKKTIIPMMITLVLLIMILVFPIFILSDQAEKEVIDQFFEGVITCNGKMIVSLLPEELIDEMEEEGISRSDVEDKIERRLKSAMEMLNYTDGKEIDYSYKIKNIKKVSEADLIDLQDEYLDVCELEISEAATMEIQVQVYEQEKNNNTILEIGLMKMNHKWYLDVISTADLLW